MNTSLQTALRVPPARPAPDRDIPVEYDPSLPVLRLANMLLLAIAGGGAGLATGYVVAIAIGLAPLGS
jgi:hypothetical protein